MLQKLGVALPSNSEGGDVATLLADDSISVGGGAGWEAGGRCGRERAA